MKSTTVIAEVGAAHCGDLNVARELVRIAKQVNADVVKFQFWSSGARLAKQRRAESYADNYEGYALPEAWLPELRAIADKIGIGFMCTAYLPEDVAVVAPHVDAFKVASFEALYRPVIEANMAAMAGNGKPLCVSLGMGQNLRELENLMPSAMFDRVTPLHCVSAYPAPYQGLNLRRISELKQVHGWAGLSDHCDPRPVQKLMVGALAVVAGASVIEAHLRLDSTPRHNPDFPHSMSPSEFADYVWSLRTAETMLGDGSNDVQDAEQPMVGFKSVEDASGEAQQKSGKSKAKSGVGPDAAKS